MSDLRPPSLRDTRSLADVVRHHSLLLEKLAPGLIGGRSRIPDPIGLSDDVAADGDVGNDGDVDEPEWWDEDRYVASGAGTVAWTLTYAAIPESLFIRWHPGGGAGLPQIRPEDWTLGDDGQTVTIPDPDGRLEAGDLFSAQYQFLDVVNDDPVPPIPTSLTFIGSGHVVSGATEIALPDGTLEGDLIVLAIAAHAITTADCPDARMEVTHAEILNPSSPTMSSFVGYGTADASGDPLPLTMPSGSRAEVAVFRITGALGSAYTPLDGTDAPFVLDVPGGDIGIALLVGVCHLVPAGFGDDSTGEWTTVSPGMDSGGTTDASTLIAYCISGTPLGSWPGLDSAPRWGGFTIGLTEAEG